MSPPPESQSPESLPSEKQPGPKSTRAPVRLPHAYPFVYVDRIERIEAERIEAESESSAESEAQAILLVTAGVPTSSGAAPHLPATLLLEALAQATLALLAAPEGQDDEPAAREAPRGLLVGIDEATFDETLIERPLRPGDRLVSRCAVRGRFGAMAKVGAWMERDGARVASAEMLLASG